MWPFRYLSTHMPRLFQKVHRTNLSFIFHPFQRTLLWIFTKHPQIQILRTPPPISPFHRPKNLNHETPIFHQQRQLHEHSREIFHLPWDATQQSAERQTYNAFQPHIWNSSTQLFSQRSFTPTPILAQPAYQCRPITSPVLPTIPCASQQQIISTSIQLCVSNTTFTFLACPQPPTHSHWRHIQFRTHYCWRRSLPHKQQSAAYNAYLRNISNDTIHCKESLTNHIHLRRYITFHSRLGHKSTTTT
jgi:hypothetical protein